MKINIKKFVSGTLAVATLTTMLFTSVTASDEVITEDVQDNTPANIQIHKRRPHGFKFKGGRGHGNMNMAELTEEEKQALKEKFGERKELTEEEKQAMKEQMEEKKAEMEAKIQEKEAERKAKLDEKLANGEITQEQYDKFINGNIKAEAKKPALGRANTFGKNMMPHFGMGMMPRFGMGMMPHFGKGMEKGMGPDRCAQCGCHKTCETPEVTE